MIAQDRRAAEEIAADDILRAAGSSLRYHTMPSGRQAILAAARAALQKARAEERERCARVADDEFKWSKNQRSNSAVYSHIKSGQVGAASRIAAAIRALPEG